MTIKELTALPKVELHCHLDGSLSRGFIEKRLGRKVSQSELSVSEDCRSLNEYLEKKKKKADKPNYDHVVQVGESMHSIAQKYGIQIKSLYKMNKKHKDYIPEEGDVLKLR